MMANPPTGSAADWKAELLGLARWWRAEAVARLPARFRGGDRPELLAVAEGEELVLVERAPDGTRRPLGRLSAALGMAGAIPRDGRPVLVLRPDRVLRRTLTLPRAAEAHLREVVGLELERRTPLRADQAWFAADPVRRSADGREVEVEVTVLPRAAARDAIRTLEAAGLPPAWLELAEPDGRTVRMPLEDAGGDRPVSRAGRIALAAVAGVALLLVAAYGWQSWRLARVEAEVAALAARSGAVLDAADRVAALRDRAFFAVERKREAPSPLVVMEALARLLPDGTWLTELRFDGETVQLVGLSDDSARLIPLMEESPHFAEAQYRSALIRDAGGLDRFNLVAKVVPHAAP